MKDTPAADTSMAKRLLLIGWPGVALAWLLSSSPGCTNPGIHDEPPGWWEEISAGMHAWHDEGQDDDWVDFDDGGDYADDTDDYLDDEY
jgi:hypothetical protein